MSPIEQTSKEVLAAVLFFGGKNATAEKLKIPRQTLTKLINETFPGGPQGDQSRRARIRFDEKFLSLTPAEKRDVSQLATAFRKLTSPGAIEQIKKNPDIYSGKKRFKAILKALRYNKAKGYGVRLTTYQNPNRVSLVVHKPKRKAVKKIAKKSKRKAVKKVVKKGYGTKTVPSNRRRSNKR